MSTQVSESFIKQFEADVHLAYQQNGSKLRNTVPVSYTHLTLPTKLEG